MGSLDWLAQHRFQHLKRRESDWVFSFDGNALLTVNCLWRLLEAGQLKRTSQDDGQKFGLPAPVNAAIEVNRLLASASVVAVELRGGTLDVRLKLSTGHELEILPDSAGYEAWVASDGSKEFIACGGGRIDEY